MRALLGTGCVLLAALLVTTCGRSPAEQPEVSAAEPRDAAHVLNALVEQWYEEPFIDERSQTLLLRSETWPGFRTHHRWEEYRGRLPELLEGLRADTLAEFERANRTPMDLTTVLKTTHPIQFVDVKVLKETVGSTHNSHEYDQALRQLLGRYPDSRQLVSLSVPGVSPDGMQALLYASELMGARVAAGYYFLLVWEDGAWRIASKHMAWIS